MKSKSLITVIFAVLFSSFIAQAQDHLHEEYSFIRETYENLALSDTNFNYSVLRIEERLYV